MSVQTKTKYAVRAIPDDRTRTVFALLGLLPPLLTPDVSINSGYAKACRLYAPCPRHKLSDEHHGNRLYTIFQTTRENVHQANTATRAALSNPVPPRRA